MSRFAGHNNFNFCVFSFELDFVRFRTKSGEEGEDDARSAWPSDTLGYTRGTMAATTRCDGVSLS